MQLVKVKELRKGDLFIDPKGLGFYEVVEDVPPQRILGDFRRKVYCYFSNIPNGWGEYYRGESWWKLEEKVWKVESSCHQLEKVL